MHLQRSKSTLVSLAAVFWMQLNVDSLKKCFQCILGGNRPWVPLGPCGFRPFDFDSKLKIENQNFTILIFNV